MIYLLKKIINCFTFIFKVFTATLNGIFILIYKLLDFVIKRFKFSIGFKINFLYSLLYISLFYFSSLAIGETIISTFSMPSEDMSHFISDYKIFVLVYLGISLGIFILLGNKLAHGLLRPIQEMTSKVKEINVTSLDRLDTNLAKDELKELAITCNEMLDRLEAYMNQQKQFVSDASHELRTPIAIIQGYTDMLERWGKDDPAILDESINSLSQETANMKNLLEKLLFLSRSDKGTLKVDRVTFNLSKLCEEVLKETTFIDDEHELKSKIMPDVYLYGDQGLIKELIRILIDNALKYTPEGGVITLSCVISKQDIILSIKDNGIGIPKQHIPHLFERFYRVDEARNKDTGGTGLGLAIAHKIVQSHEAQISVASEINHGSEFIIFFPNNLLNNKEC